MKKTGVIIIAVCIGFVSICKAQPKNPSLREQAIIVEYSASVPSVKSMEFEKTVTPFVMGESDKYYVKYDDGVAGYVFYSKKYKTWYITNGTDDYEYTSKEYALDALYHYKADGSISKEGRKN